MPFSRPPWVTPSSSLTVWSSIDWVMISSPTRLMIWSTLSTETRIELDSPPALAFFALGLPLSGLLSSFLGSAVAASAILAAVSAAAAASGDGGGAAWAAGAAAWICSCSGSTMKHITASMSSRAVAV